ncbi:hypothetical protein BGZ50_006891 [Haplosporangium sp. Z 11]|nr:hypothetical protein BGZ50_006891 [Haplosporangium sp. Z 11]
MELGVSHGFVTKVRQKDKENISKPKMGRPVKAFKRTRQALRTKFLTNDLDDNHKYEEAQEYICSVGEGPVHRDDQVLPTGRVSDGASQAGLAMVGRGSHEV